MSKVNLRSPGILVLLSIRTIIKKGVFDSSYGLCIKNLYVSYIRKYFKIEDIRITIDKNILFESPDKKKDIWRIKT